MASFSGTTFRQLRALAQELGNENITVTKTDGTTEEISRAEYILRKWASSSDFKAQQAFIEVAYGRTPAITEISGPDGAPIELKNLPSLSDDQLEQIVRQASGS